MPVNTFLKAHHPEINKIINDLNQEFSSHDFIEKFARMFEREYIEMLYNYRNTGKAFQTVHSAIAKYLSLYNTQPPIVKITKKGSENVFGELDVIQWWSK